ncbi:MAG TPA: hypothetical protein VER03_16335 [Bryobacteraceae bacterium]|nr:hypothetical protein [Bryobacteraceae bacterium]
MKDSEGWDRGIAQQQLKLGICQVTPGQRSRDAPARQRSPLQHLAHRPEFFPATFTICKAISSTGMSRDTTGVTAISVCSELIFTRNVEGRAGIEAGSKEKRPRVRGRGEFL